MPKPRQGQRKQDGTTATPKPSCKNHDDPVIMERLYTQKKKPSGNRGWIKWGWGCPDCGKAVKDKMEENN